MQSGFVLPLVFLLASHTSAPPTPLAKASKLCQLGSVKEHLASTRVRHRVVFMGKGKNLDLNHFLLYIFPKI